MIFDHLIYNALVLTLEPGAAPLPDGYVAVAGERIAAVGQRPAGGALPDARAYLNARGGLVLPGLVNTHTHAAMVLFRGLADDLPLHDWLQQHIFPAEAAFLSDAAVYAGTLLAAAELILGGVTTVQDSYFYADAARRAFARAGLRAVVAQGVVDFPAPGVPDPADNVRAAADFIAAGEARPAPGIISTLFCHAPYTCSAATLQAAKDLTRSRGLPFFIHLAETRDEDEQIRRQTGLSPAAHLDSLGLLDDRTVAVHAVWLSDADQDLLAARGVKVSHCPESNLKLAAGVAPVPGLLRRGVAVGLGTDGAASNNNLDLFGEMSLAARLHKVIHADPTLLPARQVVALATREGARVLGLEGAVGTLSPGKLADLIVVDLHQPHLTPLYDPFSHLVYAARAADVRHVMVAGRWLLRDRTLTTLEGASIQARIAALTAPLISRASPISTSPR